MISFFFAYSLEFTGEEFEYDGFYYTTLSEHTVRTGAKNVNSNCNALVDKSKMKTGFEIRIPETVTHNSISYTVTEIGYMSFRSANGSVIVSLPETITVVNDYAFDSLYDTVFPSLPNLQKIGYAGFISNNYKNVTLPDSLVFIGDAAFSYDTIEKIIIPENSPYFSLDEYGSLFNLEKTRVIWASHAKNITLPWTVEFIPNHLFGRRNITTIVLPPACYHIGVLSFGYSNIEALIISGNIKKVDNNAFLEASIKYIENKGTTRLNFVDLSDNGLTTAIACNQYKWSKIFGVTVTKNGDCPEMNIFNCQQTCKYSIHKTIQSSLFYIFLVMSHNF